MYLFFVLPILFIISTVLGVLLCLLGLRGLLSGLVLAPNLWNNPLGKTFIRIEGINGKAWALGELVAGLALVAFMLVGLSLYGDFRNSPAYFDSLLVPPGEKALLYADFKNSNLEAIYTFNLDAEKVRTHYLAQLKENGWKIKGKPGAATIAAEKGALKLQLIVIGSQPADKKDFKCKLLVSLVVD
mgnify:CR=1 FL=1